MRRHDPTPWVIAHRGASRDCPENTLVAFDEALAQGADGIELDVQLSRDGMPVVYHDATLARAGGGRKRVADLDLSELQRLDVGARLDKRFRGQHIPVMEHVLRRYGDRTLLLLEIKAQTRARFDARALHLAREICRMVTSLGLERSTMILSFDPDVLDACREEARAIPRVLNLRAPRRLGRALAARLDSLHSLSVDIRTLTPAFAADVRNEGVELLAWTCDTTPSVERALHAGAIGVMSNRPAWLAGLLRGGPARHGA